MDPGKHNVEDTQPKKKHIAITMIFAVLLGLILIGILLFGSM